ncbi:hypothetical protein BU15DRAFT_74070 [Melanogaster broomeanus]|nr:hypothetical protein BU15DRAFT_74070 [Melanogaster broomeanus]
MSKEKKLGATQASNTNIVTNAGYADQRVFQSRYMISPSQVDVFKDNIQLHPGARQAPEQSDSDPASCTDNWKAANSTDENTIQVFEQTGIFLSACCHGIVQTLAEMRHSGELAKYPLATINKLLDMCGNDQVIGTDIGCQLSKTVAASSLRDKAKQCSLCLAVNTFHGHAHNRWCQLQNHPLYLKGFGLEDLETCELVFASSNAAAPLIRHTSHFHYIQYLDLHFCQWDADKYLELNDPGKFLQNNYKQAIQLIADNTKDIEAYQLEYLNAVALEPQWDTLAVKYVESLEKLKKYDQEYKSYQVDQFVSYSQDSFVPGSGLSHTAARNTKQLQAARHAAERRLRLQIDVVKKLEIQMGMHGERWIPGYRETLEYIQHHRFICTVEDLESLVVQRLFELSKANLGSTGYKLQKQISKVIVRCSTAIRTALEKYNKLAPSQTPPQPILQYNDIVSYAILAEFDLLKYSQHDVLAKPWSNPTHREMAIKYFKVIRAKEEIFHLNVEIRHLQTWINDEDAHIKAAASRLEVTTGNPLTAEISDLYHRQRRVNDVHRSHLATLYKLKGYSGFVYSSTEEDGDTLDVEEEKLREEAARLDSILQQIS